MKLVILTATLIAAIQAGLVYSGYGLSWWYAPLGTIIIAPFTITKI